MSKDELLASFRKQLADLRKFMAEAPAKENQLMGAIFAMEQLADPPAPAAVNGELEPIATGAPD